MEDIKSIIGTNLKIIRKKRQLTLDALSKITSVSISMLGEIERGITNPTITVLWKIADGLKIPFTDLITEEKPPVSIVYNKDAKTIVDDSGFKIISLFNFDPIKKIEIYYKILEPGSSYESKGHLVGIEEYIMICDGTMDLQIDNKNYILSKGDSINFRGNVYHCYKNQGNITLSAYMILYYGTT
ncbi:helix-turn-helix domain-containing protein [Clostridium sp. WILCCON 0269]|uniref:Helix-turn-helix domain-containing protein n=1 Tax=Candidatus Clostridium eludens TaxID=3381663 RepID=A0ABW8SSA7_9CLOT